MKKVLSFLSVILVAAVVFSACSKDDAIVEPSVTEPDNYGNNTKTTIILRAHNGEDGSGTKTTLNGSDARLKWTTKERINLFYKGGSYRFVSTNTAPTLQIIDFKGDVFNFDGTDAEVTALYPFSKEAKIDKTTNAVTTTLPAFQVAVADNIADSLFISMAKGTINGALAAGDMFFYNVCSGFAFSVTHNDIVAVEIQGMDGEDIAGTFTVKFENDGTEEVPVIQGITNGVKTITTYAPNGTFEVGKQYHMAVLPTQFANGIYITGYTADGKGYELALSKSGGIKFNRSKFSRKQNFDSGLDKQDIFTYTLDATAPSHFMYAEGEREYSVKCYRTRISTSATEPMAWKVQVSTDAGATWNDLTDANKASLGVDWLTFTPNGTLNTSDDFETFKVVAATNTNEVSRSNAETLHKNQLIANTGLFYGGIDNSTEANAIDLSLYDVAGTILASGRTTANCYVVRAPGWYKIPIVYGNAITNGAVNYDSFKASIYDSWFLTPFRNHANQGLFSSDISTEYHSAWITKNYNGIKNPSVLWQDTENLVKNVKTSNNSDERQEDKFILFYVDPANICQGNAVIAIRRWTSGPIVWSWHIWVTDEDLNASTQTVTNYEGDTYEFMANNIGWTVKGDRVEYGDREALVRIAPVYGNATPIVFNLVQEGETVETTGYNPYYQWGRKDPMLPGFNGTDVDYWGADGKNDGTWSITTALMKYTDAGGSSAVASSSKQRLASYICNPATFNCYQEGGYGKMDNSFHNLWNINSGRQDSDTPDYNNPKWTTKARKKTIYDPSPVGFMVPQSRAFSGFIKGTAADHLYHSDALIHGSQTAKGIGGMLLEDASGYDNGFYFFTDDTRTAKIFFPITGMRSQSDGSADSFESDGYYWSADSPYTGQGMAFMFGQHRSLLCDDSYAMIKQNYKATGFPVRSIRE